MSYTKPIPKKFWPAGAIAAVETASYSWAALVIEEGKPIVKHAYAPLSFQEEEFLQDIEDNWNDYTLCYEAGWIADLLRA